MDWIFDKLGWIFNFVVLLGFLRGIALIGESNEPELLKMFIIFLTMLLMWAFIGDFLSSFGEK